MRRVRALKTRGSADVLTKFILTYQGAGTGGDVPIRNWWSVLVRWHRGVDVGSCDELRERGTLWRMMMMVLVSTRL